MLYQRLIVPHCIAQPEQGGGVGRDKSCFSHLGMMLFFA